jgi:hypothetical protein
MGDACSTSRAQGSPGNHSLDKALRITLYLSDMNDFAHVVVRLAAASVLAAALALFPATASAAVIYVPCSSENNANVLQNVREEDPRDVPGRHGGAAGADLAARHELPGLC